MPPEERADQLAKVLPERDRGGLIVLRVDSLLETDTVISYGAIEEDVKYFIPVCIF